MKFEQMPPEYQESPFSYLVNEMGIDMVYPGISIYGNRDYKDYTTEKFNDVMLYAYQVADLIQDYFDGDNTYDSIEDIVLQFFEPVVKDWDLWTKTLKNYDETDDDICNMLFLLTGEKYNYSMIRGDFQGEWQKIYFPIERYTSKDIKRITAEYFNTGSEWIDEDDCSYYIISYLDDDIKAELADKTSIPIEDVKLLKFDGWERKAKYVEV